MPKDEVICINSICKRCGRNSHIEKHHILPKSEGGSNNPRNIRKLCKDCHDYEHARRDVEKKLVYYKKMISLLGYRLQVINDLNSVEKIVEFGYRSYWIDPKTHGARIRGKYRRNRKK
jgi:hypothetical protein